MITTKDNEYCCKNMDYYADEFNFEEHQLVKYNAHRRDYDFILHGKNYGMDQEMYFCPWCGTKLPKSLGKEWCEVIKEELGIEDVFAEEWEKLPEKYKTDQWWKERGL